MVTYLVKEDTLSHSSQRLHSSKRLHNSILTAWTIFPLMLWTEQTRLWNIVYLRKVFTFSTRLVPSIKKTILDNNLKQICFPRKDGFNIYSFQDPRTALKDKQIANILQIVIKNVAEDQSQWTRRYVTKTRIYLARSIWARKRYIIRTKSTMEFLWTP